MRNSGPIRCLILACGNTLRGDDGVGPWLAAWAEERFRDDADVRVMARQQWGPELAEEIARADSVLFVDSSLQCPAGTITVTTVASEPAQNALGSHHLSAAELLGLTQALFASLPRRAALLTVGAEALAFHEGLSARVQAALPETCAKIEEIVQKETPPQA